MKYYIIAGERSGDLHGSNLIKALKKKDPDGDFRGFGGDYMAKAGADIVVHYRELAVMGFVEVFFSLFKIKKLMSFCVRDIRSFQPDAVIFIDFAGFNLRMAKKISAFRAKKFYYISPKIWAWNQNRVYKVKAYIDTAFVILPFEKDFYAKFDVNAKYVGNPVNDAVNVFDPDPKFYSRHKIIDSDGIIALLPGSRKQELKYLLPVMTEVARRFPQKTFGLSVIQNLPAELYEAALEEPNIIPVTEDNYNLLLNADAAVVTSGTATLETALFDVPQVVVYRTSNLNYAIGKQFVKVDFISLVNLIVNELVVKELIQDDLTPDSVAKELKSLLEDRSRQKEIRLGYNKLRKILSDKNASVNTAEEIYDILSVTRNEFS